MRKTLLFLGVALALVFGLVSCDEFGLPFGLATLDEIQGFWSTGMIEVTSTWGDEDPVSAPTVVQVIIDGTDFELYICSKIGDVWILLYGIIGEVEMNTEDPEMVKLKIEVSQFFDKDIQAWIEDYPFDDADQVDYEISINSDGQIDIILEGSGEEEVEFKHSVEIHWNVNDVYISFNEQPEALDVEVTANISTAPPPLPLGDDQTDTVGISVARDSVLDSDVDDWAEEYSVYTEVSSFTHTFSLTPGNYMLGAGIDLTSNDTWDYVGTYGDVEPESGIRNVPVFDGNTSFEFTIYPVE